MDEVIKETGDKYRGLFETFSVNTSSKKFAGNVKQTCEAIASKMILTWVEEYTEESILSAPRTALLSSDTDLCVKASQATNIVKQFESVGDFRPRRRVEADTTRIQPLPVVVVRNKSGHILQLIRKERDPKNKLHKSVAVWAGGHVHREDKQNGHSITHGAVRELQEELRLYVEPASLRLLGAVYIPHGTSTRKHMAIVYEWKAPNDDVEVTLAKSEFFEKGGASLTGVFRPPEQIAPTEEGLEAWSVAILTNLLQKKNPKEVRSSAGP